jgi:nitrite reductase/ring-hydroxylating ferredoxin subunit
VDGGAIKVALFNVGGAYHALDNTCAHRGGPLGEGDLSGKAVTCPWHHWSFDVTTGRSTMSPGLGVRSFPVEVRGEEIYVDIA